MSGSKLAVLPERRIVVYGVTGSGKSSLARRIAASLDIPYVAVDDLTWEPGWTPVPNAEQLARFERIAATESWVLDAAYTGWRDTVLDRAQLVVCLDYPRLRSLARLTRRTVIRMVTRERICNGNTESLRVAVSRDSILIWHFRSFGRQRERMRAWAACAPGPTVRVLLFRSPKDASAWLAGLSAG